ncbi:MAG: diguanylate cyclase [Rhodocyclales bacterium]|nr:diguanylate cyclase [Rhodocyclales bacterium]
MLRTCLNQRILPLVDDHENGFKPMLRLITPRLLAAASIVFLLAAAAAAGLIWHAEQHNFQEERSRVTGLAKDHAHALETGIERALSATYALAALVRQGNGSVTNFNAVANQMLQFYPGVSALALSPGGVVRDEVPLAGNENAIGFDPLRDPVQSKEALIARDTGKLTLAGPMNLVQGGMGVVGRLPVFLEDAQGKPRFWGFTNVVIRFPEVLAGARLPQLVDQGVDYELSRTHPDSGQKQIIAASSSTPLVAPVQQDLKLVSGNWTLSVAPVKGWGDPLELWLKVLLGLLFSLLLGYMTILIGNLRSHQEELEQKVTERTQALARANDDLAGREALFRQILDTSSVAIFVVDMEGRITQANQRMAEMFGYSRNTLVGHEYVALVHPAEREQGRQKMLALLTSAVPTVDLDRLYWRADRTEFWGHLTARRFYDANGEERGLIGVIADITARKNVEEKLLRQNDILNTIIENFPGAISMVDADLRLVAHNEQFKTLLELPDSLFDKPAVNFEDIVRFNAERGEYGPGDTEQQVAAMVARARNFQPHKIERVRANGTALEIRGMPRPGGGFVTIYIDITERKQMEEQVHQLAFYDALTKLANRRLLNDRLNQTMAAGKRSRLYGALMFLDLDNFKPLNDLHGHEVGDLLLSEVATRLKRCVREIDTAARFGGDEFVVMLCDLNPDRAESAAQAMIVAKRIQTALAAPYLLTRQDGTAAATVEHHCTASIGVALFIDHETSQADLLKWADTAMYQAKAAGRNSIRFHGSNA